MDPSLIVKTGSSWVVLAGNLRTASGKCTIKTPKFCSCFTSEECHPAERRSTLWLLPHGFKHIPLLPPQSLPCIPSRGKSKEAGVYLIWGRHAKWGKARTRNQRKLWLWIPEEQHKPFLHLSLSCVYFHSLSVSVHRQPQEWTPSEKMWVSKDLGTVVCLASWV